MDYKEIIQYLIKSTPQNNEEVLAIKRKFCKAYKTEMPTNSELLSVYREMIKKKKIRQNKKVERLLTKRQIRTLSGVAPIAVLTKPYKCPGNCLYCPTEKGIPKSYLSNEPAVMRAQLCEWHPFKQVALRIKALEANGHSTDKLELIIMGGTWSYLPRKYQLWYVYVCYKAANEPSIKIQNPKSKILNKSKTQNSKNNQQGTIEININIKLKNQSQVTW